MAGDDSQETHAKDEDADLTDDVGGPAAEEADEPSETGVHREKGDRPDRADAMAAGVQREPQRFQLWFLLAALLTVVGMLSAIVATDAWDPYVCESDDDCRGLKECIEGHCASPEVWHRQRGQPASTD